MLEHLHYPSYIIVPGLTLVCCLLLRCLNDEPVKCTYIGPIGKLTNTQKVAKILHTRRDLMLMHFVLKNKMMNLKLQH